MLGGARWAGVSQSVSRGTAVAVAAIHARTAATQPRSRTDSNVNAKMVMESYVMRGRNTKKGA